MRHLLEQLKGYGVVSEVDRHDQFSIRPIIAHLANPENLTGLLVAFRQEAELAEGAGVGVDSPGDSGS